MRHKFEFDKKTGTMRPVAADASASREAKPAPRSAEGKADGGVSGGRADGATRAPSFAQERRVEVKSAASAAGPQVVKMARVDKPTPVQLVDARGLPEAYLDSVTTGVMMFRERQDYDICQIVDEKTGKPLAYIGGYALQINFNMAELNTMERIEQCLQGMVKLFRHKIMNQALGGSKGG